MAYIRAKQRTYKHAKRPPWLRQRPERTTRTYYYVVESYRNEAGKVRQRTLAYLGKYPTVEEALHSAVTRLVGATRRWANKQGQWREKLETLAGARGRKAEREHAWYAEQLERMPKRIESHRKQIAELREAAHALGIDDPEALFLPETEARREIETTVAEIQKHHEAIFALARAAGRL